MSSRKDDPDPGDALKATFANRIWKAETAEEREALLEKYEQARAIPVTVEDQSQQRRRRHPWRAPKPLRDGIALVNRLRARAVEPDALRALDMACVAALSDWAEAIASHRPTPPTSPLVPELSPGDALVIGTLFWLAQQPPLPDLVEQHPVLGTAVRYEHGSPDARLALEPGRWAAIGLTSPLARLFGVLTKDSREKWQLRVRRCPYRSPKGRVHCYQFFIDESPWRKMKDAKVACSEHSSRLSELGAAKWNEKAGDFVLRRDRHKWPWPR